MTRPTTEIMSVRQDETGHLYVYDREGALVVSYPRSIPSDKADNKMAEDMITDVAMVCRSAITLILRSNPAAARLPRITTAARSVAEASKGLNEKLADQ